MRAPDRATVACACLGVIDCRYPARSLGSSTTALPLIGARQWIPAEHIDDLVRSAAVGLPAGLVFRTKGQLAVDLCADAFADGVRLNGTGVNQRFITGASVPVGVAVTSTSIYWANNATGTIGRANLNGTGVNQRFITGATGPSGLAINATHIYWANEYSNTIGRANLHGTGVNQRFITGAHSPPALAIDATYVYWANFKTGAIGRAKRWRT